MAGAPVCQAGRLIAHCPSAVPSHRPAEHAPAAARRLAAVIAACMRTGHPAHGFRFFEVMQSMGVEVR